MLRTSTKYAACRLESLRFPYHHWFELFFDFLHIFRKNDSVNDGSSPVNEVNELPATTDTSVPTNSLLP